MQRIERVGCLFVNCGHDRNASGVGDRQSLGRHCVQGAKPAVSFDERFMVFHHYVGANDYADLGYGSASDPAFQAILAAGSSNIVVVDLVTGAWTRVRNNFFTDYLWAIKGGGGEDLSSIVQAEVEY